MAKKITMHVKTATGYDMLHSDTHIAQVKCPTDVATAVGAETNDGQAVMQSISATDKMISGYGTTTGTSKAFVLTLEDKPDMAIVDGMMIRVKFHVASDVEPTIDVNDSGVKNIYSLNQNKLLFTIAQNVWVVMMYSSSLDGWIVQGWAKKKVFHTEIFTKTTNWVVPEVVGEVNVRLFGGGGGGGKGKNVGYNNPPCGSGGNGGYMEAKSLSIKYGDIILITVGKGGVSDSSGGATSFGTLLSANGGAPRDVSATGGSGAGGGRHGAGGGNGIYGGGGGGGYGYGGGNGGTYGGGGGGNAAIVISGRYTPTKGGTGKNGAFAGGTSTSQSNGGSGGGYTSASTNNLPGKGQDTRGLGLDFEGEGKAGSSIGSGGGGYGGNGGNDIGGGGGGYGANGGYGNSYGGGGGGGGYGGNGGNGSSGGGGGGGYGANGNGGTGGSYGVKGGNGGLAAGGGGGYADSSSTTEGGAGGSGVCILTYWSWDSEY